MNLKSFLAIFELYSIVCMQVFLVLYQLLLPTRLNGGPIFQNPGTHTESYMYLFNECGWGIIEVVK